jgi:CRP-like cAMP-binding protein
MVAKFENISLFKDLNEDTLQLFAPLFETCICHEGIIFEQGTPAVHIYLLLEGSVDILYKPYDAPPITITNVKPGGIFGWSAIAGNNVYTSGAICHGKSKALRIQGNALRKLCLDYPEAGELLLDRLAQSVSKRWHNAHAQVREILSQGVSNNL